MLLGASECYLVALVIALVGGNLEKDELRG
jgi:hypothetical protein